MSRLKAPYPATATARIRRTMTALATPGGESNHVHLSFSVRAQIFMLCSTRAQSNRVKPQGSNHPAFSACDGFGPIDDPACRAPILIEITFLSGHRIRFSGPRTAGSAAALRFQSRTALLTFEGPQMENSGPFIEASILPAPPGRCGRWLRHPSDSRPTPACRARSSWR